MLKGENYCITSKNLICHEFIGLYARVQDSTDKNKTKIRGKIIDETKNLFLIKTKNGVKKVPKKEAVFDVFLEKEIVSIEGKKIVIRPAERIKQFWRKC